MPRKKQKFNDMNFDEMEVEVLPPVRQVKTTELATKNDKRFSAKFRVTPDSVEITFDLWLRGKSKLS